MSDATQAEPAEGLSAEEPDAFREFQVLYRDWLTARAARADPDGPDEDDEDMAACEWKRDAAEMALLAMPAPNPACFFQKWEVLERRLVASEAGDGKLTNKSRDHGDRRRQGRYLAVRAEREVRLRRPSKSTPAAGATRRPVRSRYKPPNPRRQICRVANVTEALLEQLRARFVLGRRGATGCAGADETGIGGHPVSPCALGRWGPRDLRAYRLRSRRSRILSAKRRSRRNQRLSPKWIARGSIGGDSAAGSFVKEPKAVALRGCKATTAFGRAAVVGTVGSRDIISGADDRRYCEFYPTDRACCLGGRFVSRRACASAVACETTARETGSQTRATTSPLGVVLTARRSIELDLIVLRWGSDRKPCPDLCAVLGFDDGRRIIDLAQIVPIIVEAIHDPGDANIVGDALGIDDETFIGHGAFFREAFAPVW